MLRQEDATWAQLPVQTAVFSSRHSSAQPESGGRGFGDRFGGAAGLFGSVVLSLSGILDHISEKAGQYLGLAVGVALAVPVGVWVFQIILEKDFGEFRIRLVPKAPSASVPAPIDESTS